MENLTEKDFNAINQDTIVIDIESSNVFKLDLKSLNYKNIVINLSNGAKVSILNVVNASHRNITCNLKEDTYLDYGIASFEKECGNSVEVNLKENSVFNGAYADFSYGENNFDFSCNLNGRGSKALWHLASLTKNCDKKNFTISFFHHARNTYAKMENYGVCEDSSSLNFLGTSRIFNGAKESATHQSAKIMVFDKKCSAKASPTLCIDENDVQASHAAVVGQINEDHIFYLTSRGIDEKSAKKLITLGYLTPILSYFKDEETLNIIKTNIEERV